jgi:nucleoside-diphosphate-sugar epimerase
LRVLVTGGSGFIGTIYVDTAMTAAVSVRNIDWRPPMKGSHGAVWTECSMLDVDRLRATFAEFTPTHVVHLAAVTGVRGTAARFEANVVGVRNLLSVIAACPSVERVVFTSSTLVCRIGYVPRCDTVYCPTTAYGASKARMEQAVRSATNVGCSWTIVRPVAIWGPWFGEPYRKLFEAIRAGWYCHIGSGNVRKSLGYVENTAHQIQCILTAPCDAVDGKTLYLADHPPVTLYEFAETVRRELKAKKLRHVPQSLARSAAAAGDVLRWLGWDDVPLTTFRLNNILTEYVYDVSPIMEIAGPMPYTLEDGVRRTAQWLQESYWLLP